MKEGAVLTVLFRLLGVPVTRPLARRIDDLLGVVYTFMCLTEALFTHRL